MGEYRAYHCLIEGSSWGVEGPEDEKLIHASRGISEGSAKTIAAQANENARLRALLSDIASAALRDNGPLARDRDYSTLKAIGLSAERAVSQ